MKAFNHLFFIESFIKLLFCSSLSQARNYIKTLPCMPKRNFSDVFIGANPLGKLLSLSITFTYACNK